MKTENYNLFSTFIKKYYLNIDNKELENYVYNIKTSDVGVEKSNANGWQSNNLKLYDNHKDFSQLLSSLHYCARDYFFSVGVDCEQWQPFLNGVWANINEKYSYNHKHLHTGFCSGVYYIKADGDEGNIRFCHPSPAKQMSWIKPYFREPNHETNASEWYFTPEENTLYVFPSWLEHYVEMNYTSKNRISLSFNINIIRNTQ